MPLIAFNFTSPVDNGEARQFVQKVTLPFRLPSGTRFTLKQVSALSNVPELQNLYHYVAVFIPELMGSTNHVFFHNFEMNNNTITNSWAEPALRFYKVSQNFEAFPNLHMGRFYLQTNELTLYIKAMSKDAIQPLKSYTVVLEWDTE